MAVNTYCMILGDGGAHMLDNCSTLTNMHWGSSDTGYDSEGHPLSASNAIF